eukprot:CAMPEP_0185784344 /NCGR_PEP_ID=MMETSP1174-20130828/122581_1 /TAXON_ID=35687 /ORGANISM="Dictyocha speculum, Strain CCMP1381" /LENGTH=37 /DNA_ID= /DNA_START= /DNA_END= /DNA_ORIENTATION=
MSEHNVTGDAINLDNWPATQRKTGVLPDESSSGHTRQ